MQKLSFKQISQYSRKVDLLKVLKHYKIDYEEQPGTNRWLSVCPFHEDEHPSLVVYHNDDDTWSWCCYSCGINGDVFQFIRLKEDNSFSRAIKVLLIFLDEINIDNSLVGLYEQLKEESQIEESQREKIFAYKHYLGIAYREWLKLQEQDTQYKQHCIFVDTAFQELDIFFQQCYLAQDAEEYYNDKLQLLDSKR